MGLPSTSTQLSITCAITPEESSATNASSGMNCSDARMRSTNDATSSGCPTKAARTTSAITGRSASRSRRMTTSSAMGGDGSGATLYAPPGDEGVSPACPSTIRWALGVVASRRTGGVSRQMCCVIASLFALGPRAAILFWWLLEPVRWGATFDTFPRPVRRLPDPALDDAHVRPRLPGRHYRLRLRLAGDRGRDGRVQLGRRRVHQPRSTADHPPRRPDEAHRPRRRLRLPASIPCL